MVVGASEEDKVFAIFASAATVEQKEVRYDSVLRIQHIHLMDPQSVVSLPCDVAASVRPLLACANFFSSFISKEERKGKGLRPTEPRAAPTCLHKHQIDYDAALSILLAVI